MSAKQEATQQKRLLQLISDSENQTNAWKDNKYQKNNVKLRYFYIFETVKSVEKILYIHSFFTF